LAQGYFTPQISLDKGEVRGSFTAGASLFLSQISLQEFFRVIVVST